MTKELAEITEEDLKSEDSKILFQLSKSIQDDLREIKSDISRIDANIEIIATSSGYPYSKAERLVSRFGDKVS